MALMLFLKIKGNYGIEFDVLGYQPENGSRLHSLIVIKMMAWELNISWWTDLSFAELIQKLGRKSFRNFT
jgi:penicillin amidase